MATHFERQLEELHVQIITMGSLCEKVISLSNRAIRGDKCIQEIFDTDKEIDDDQVDDAFNQIKEELAELMYQNLDAKTGLDLLMTAKYMERIGDHAVNIADWVEYAINGVHRNNEHQLGGH